jgi:hypothetical protein
MSGSQSERSGRRLRVVPQQVIIRASGTTYKMTAAICAFAIVLFLIDAAKGAYQHNGAMAAIWLAGAGFFAAMLVRTATARVTLGGGRIRYGNFLQGVRSLGLDEIASAHGEARSGGRSFAHYLVIEPLDKRTRAMRIRTDFFSHTDVQTIRDFLGAKLKTHHRP